MKNSTRNINSWIVSKDEALLISKTNTWLTDILCCKHKVFKGALEIFNVTFLMSKRISSTRTANHKCCFKRFLKNTFMRLIIILSFGVTSETHYFAFIFLDVSTWIIGRHCKNFSPNTTCYSNFSDTLKNWPNLKPFVNLDSSISKTKNASTSSQSEDKAMLALFRQRVLVKTNFWVHLSLIYFVQKGFLYIGLAVRVFADHFQLWKITGIIEL